MKALYYEDDISVCTYDIDFAGHVSNIVYLRWLEDMRLRMFNHYCSFKHFIDIGMTPVITSTEIKYVRSVGLFDKPRCKMWVSSLDNVSMVIDAEIYLQEQVTTRARFTGVFVNMKTMRPTRVPKEFALAVQKSDSEAVCVV